ncbi:Mce family protein [Gordonia effusa NBRC 100432]|uniref:Mce family protein n=1 Tax=Gordonia effusa NBRC 100432 TaxID=1077974 RepID=H0R5M6_9ACTN|nr:MlaD family protein [Gordonia effusa]GAB20377.1 Mce family protein [Gordonia effusa NBRC 100432]
MNRRIVLHTWMIRRLITVGLATLTLLVASGCSSAFSPERLPTPQSVHDGWPLTIEFTTVVNLPVSSKVTINGIRAGVVDSIRSEGSVAVVRLSVNDGYVVGKDAQVELRQDTLLGDTYVSISNPANAWSNRLAPGQKLTKDHVKPPVQVEDLMVSLANFLGSGSLPQLGNTFRKVNAQFPDRPAEVTRVMGPLVETLNAYANNTTALTSMLNSVAGLTTQLNEQRPMLETFMSPAGVMQVRGAMLGIKVIELFSMLDRGLTPLVPAVPLIDGLSGVVNTVIKPLLIPGWPNYHGQPANATALFNLLNDKLIPFFKNTPRLNIRQLAIDNGVSNAELAGQMVKAFRTIGMVP